MPGSPDNHRTPIRLTRRGRAVVVAFIAAVALVLLWVTVGPGALAGGGESRAPSAPGETVVVDPGETLWEIASDIDPDGDPRLMVQRIMSLNGMADDPHRPAGAGLRIPSR